MADLDLIPSDYARDRGLEGRLRGFFIALAIVLALVALGRAGFEFLIARENAGLARLRALGQASAQEAAKTDAVRKQKLETEKLLAELNELRGHDRLRLLLSAIDNAYVNSIWLDEIRFFRRDNVTTGTLDVPGGSRAGIIVVPKQNVPAPGSTIKPPEIEQRVEITGHALTHTQLAEFMRGLGRQAGIADVRLLDTGLRNYTSAVVVDLKISLLIDEKSQGAR